MAISSEFKKLEGNRVNDLADNVNEVADSVNEVADNVNDLVDTISFEFLNSEEKPLFMTISSEWLVFLRNCRMLLLLCWFFFGIAFTLEREHRSEEKPAK